MLRASEIEARRKVALVLHGYHYRVTLLRGSPLSRFYSLGGTRFYDIHAVIIIGGGSFAATLIQLWSPSSMACHKEIRFHHAQHHVA